ncbi:putative F-box/LRR-repeat protein At3g28410 isoform X2 [Miscanthus floridulus]|uniref:putative F-box/LRR-repeat protein At3g28410 isoform X2 n=1 Tax=Miscanthus floridulus TaxID=154761 RepID=UPI003459734A
MPPSKRAKLDGAALPDAGGDRISALPDDALHHVLAFLPAEDAVRTCVLARRWRHLWKSATGLRIGFGHGDTPPFVDSLRHFVNHLLLLRKRDSCLLTCELRLGPRVYWLVEERNNLNLWIRHVVDREVRMLRLEIHDFYYGFHLDNLPLVSQHLKTLALIGVCLNSLCNFSNCPNLEHLVIAESYIYEAPQISSKSLKHLSINDCYFGYKGSHTLICTPNLVSLRLDGHFASVPVLGSMPSLKEAFARDHIWDCGSEDCFSCNGFIPDESDYKNKCFLLQGLSEAENLTLMCDYNGVVFRRDLEWCPTFNNLRTLLLNEWWCLDPDFYGLNLISSTHRFWRSSTFIFLLRDLNIKWK